MDMLLQDKLSINFNNLFMFTKSKFYYLCQKAIGPNSAWGVMVIVKWSKAKLFEFQPKTKTRVNVHWVVLIPSGTLADQRQENNAALYLLSVGSTEILIQKVIILTFYTTQNKANEEASYSTSFHQKAGWQQPWMDCTIMNKAGYMKQPTSA